MQLHSLAGKPEELDPFFTVSLDLLCIANMDGYFLRLNPEWETTLGYRIDELHNKRFVEFVHPDDIAFSLDVLFGLASQRKAIDFMNRYRCKNGTYRWLQWRAAPAGNLIYAAARDVTQQKSVEDALCQSDRRYKDFISHSNEGVWRVELKQPLPIDLPAEESVQRLLRDAYFAECNLAQARNLGFSSAEEVVGKRYRDVVPPPDLDEGRTEAFRSAVGSGFRSRTVEFRGLDRTGNTKHFLRTEIPIIENGMLVRAWGITCDVTELKQAEDSLRESEVRFRTTFENAGIGIALMNLRGYPIQSNPTLQKTLGYSAAELCGMAFTEFTYPPDRELSWKLYRDLVAGQCDKYTLEKRYIKKGGQIMWARVTVSLVKDRNGEPDYAIGMVEDNTERKRAQEEVQRSFEQLRALAGRLQTIREEERKRVAREIHDELGQALTAVKIDLTSLMRDVPGGAKTYAAKTESLCKLVDDTIQSVRRIAAELRPGILDDLGLVAAVEWAAEEFTLRTGTECKLHVPNDQIVIDPGHATAIFRIFQETLTNVARHAAATRVDVKLVEEAGDLLLEVHDNGKGVSGEQLSAGKSLGILGMRERAALLGGNLVFRGAPGSGTTVTVRIPETLRA
ncbi:MAG: PAS domain-containing sensor histidine kinase [Terriglobia bacterium]